MSEAALAFVVRPHERPAIEIRVNVGVFAGRAATPAGIDALASPSGPVGAHVDRRPTRRRG
ncbi:MAG TPA: hypothetical protein VFA88_05145 [Gaiellaceae bacterium]|nr:hypothetical protein [Gaiellaceae bacterium]